MARTEASDFSSNIGQRIKTLLQPYFDFSFFNYIMNGIDFRHVTLTRV